MMSTWEGTNLAQLRGATGSLLTAAAHVRKSTTRGHFAAAQSLEKRAKRIDALRIEIEKVIKIADAQRGGMK